MRWTRWILISVSVVVALVGTALLLLLTVDLGRFKSNIEHFVTETTGREFVIAGRFEPSIGTTIDLVAEDVRLANARWGTSSNILELERVVVSIDTWSLLSGPIDVLNLEVEGLTLHVEKEPETLQSSWTFDDARTDADADESEPFELPLWLRQARLQGISVTYGQGWLDAPRDLIVSDATLSEDESELLKIALSGTVGDDPIKADGLVGPLSTLLNGQGPRWELQATIGQFLASTEGTFRDLFKLQGPDIHAVMQGPSAARALARFGVPPIAHGPVDIIADISESPDGIDIRVEGAFGDLTTHIVGHVQSLTALENLELSMDIRGRNLKAVGELFDAGFLPPTEFTIDGDMNVAGDIVTLQSIKVAAGDALLAMDGRLAPTEVDPDAQLTLSASGPEIRDFLPAGLADQIPAASFEFEGIVAGGLQKPIFRELTAKLVGHDMTIASVTLTGSSGLLPTLEGMDATIDLNVADLQAVMGPWLEVALPAIPFILDGRIVESGGAFALSSVTFNAGDIQGTLDGTTGLLPSLDGLKLTSSVNGPDANRFVELYSELEDSVFVPTAPFETHGSFSKTGTNLFIDSWKLRIGESYLEMKGALGEFGNAAGIDIDVIASGPDLRLYVPDSNIDVPVPYQFAGGMKISDTTIELQEVDLRVGETTAWLDGTLPTSEQLMNADFDVRVAGPNLERFGKALNVQGLPAEAFRFEGAMKRSGQAYRVENLTAVVGDNDLGGELGLEVGEKLRISGQLESRYLDLTQLLGDEDEESAADALPPDRLIPDTPLPLNLLDIVDVDVTLRLQQFHTGSFQVGAVELTAVAVNDELHIDTSQVSLTHGGTLTGSLDLARTASDRADVQIRAIARQFEFRPPVGRDGASIDPPPKDLELELSGSGGTIRELASGANGSIALRAGKGELDNELRGFLLRDFFKQLLSAINPTTKESKRTKLVCGFLEMDVIDGMAISRASGFQTDQLSVASIGTVDLATEALDLSFRVKQREGVGVSVAGVVNPYIKVGGTLASPALELDAKRGLFSGAVAVVTGGLSILAKGAWDRYLSQDNYCEAVLEALDAGEIPAWEGPATSE